MPVKLLITACGSAADMIAIHGVSKDQFGVFRRYDVSEEDLAAFRTDTSGVLVGERIAARYGWKRGESVTLVELGRISFTVRGIFSTHGSPVDFVILAGQRFIQEATDSQGISNHVLVKLTPGADADETAAAIDALPMTIETKTQPEEAHLSVALDQLADLARFETAGALFRFFKAWHEPAYYREFTGALNWVYWLSLLMVGAVTLAGSLIGVNTMYTAIIRRISEMATQRVLGFSHFEIGQALLAKSLLIAGIGSALGIALALAIGVVGALVPQTKAVRIRLVEALRKE